VVVTAGELGPFAGFAVFLTVFYCNACYQRYCSTYNAAIGIQGKLHNISYYLRAYYTQPTNRWNVLRYLLASSYLFYWTLRDLMRTWGTIGYRKDKDPEIIEGDPKSFAELCEKVLLPKSLLIEPEVEMLKKYKGDKHKLMYSWCIIALSKIMSTPAPNGEFNNPYLATKPEQTELLKNVKEQIVELRGSMGAINNTFLFPVPFTYYHIVNTTVITYLMILSWCFLYMTAGTGFQGSWWSLFIYPLICVFFLGLKEMGNAMSDPFGNDICDFNQVALVNGIYNECQIICHQP